MSFLLVSLWSLSSAAHRHCKPTLSNVMVIMPVPLALGKTCESPRSLVAGQAHPGPVSAHLSLLSLLLTPQLL